MTAPREGRRERRRGKKTGQRRGKCKADMAENGHQCDRQAGIGGDRRYRHAENKPTPSGGIECRLQYLHQDCAGMPMA